MSKRVILLLVVIAALVIGGCGQAEPTQAPATAVPTKAPEATKAPEPEPAGPEVEELVIWWACRSPGAATRTASRRSGLREGPALIWWLVTASGSARQ